MSDLPTDRTGASDPDVAAALAAMPPDQRAALLAEVGAAAGVPVAAQPSVTAPTSPPPAQPTAETVKDFGVVTGEHSFDFTTREPDAFGRVILRVDGEVYECGGEVPVNSIERLMAVVGADNRLSMLMECKQMLRGVMLPDSWERYNARCEGPVVVDRGGEKVTLPAIHLTAMAQHAERLLGVYLARPSVTPPSSTDGGDSSAASTPQPGTPSTAGSPPVV